MSDATQLKLYIEAYSWVEGIPGKTLVNLALTYSLMERLTSDFLSKFGISHTKFNALVLLSKSGSTGMTLSELGDRMLVTRANITGLIDRLEKDGLVYREGDPLDRRKVRAKITDQAVQLIDTILPLYQDFIENLFSTLTPEEHKNIVGMLGKLQAKIID